MHGVISGSYSALLMFSGGSHGGEFHLLGTPSSSVLSTELLPVGPGFFETMKIPLVAGRTFTRADFESSTVPKPIVVNRTFTRTLLRSEERRVGKECKYR